MFEGTTKNAHTQGVLRFFLDMSEKSCTFVAEYSKSGIRAYTYYRIRGINAIHTIENLKNNKSLTYHDRTNY